MLQSSYTRIIPQKFGINIENRGVGATNSIYGLINIIKYDLISRNDILIFEYFINDNNHYFQGINDVNRVQKTLIQIIDMCIKCNTKLLFILIYNRCHLLQNKYEASPMFLKYKSIIDIYNVPYIDMHEKMLEAFGDDWHLHYSGDAHLSEAGHELLSDEIVKLLPRQKKGRKEISPRLPSLERAKDQNYEGFKSINVLSICDFISPQQMKTITNSLVNLQYYTISESVEIEFDDETEILAMEYICDTASGYISVEGINHRPPSLINKTIIQKQIIQKNALKKEKFVLEKMKKMASLITFNSKTFQPCHVYRLTIIDSKAVTTELYDKERKTLERTNVNRGKTNFKLVSLLVTNGAVITRFEAKA